MYHISKDKRSKESSALILEALIKLMEEKPYEKIRIVDICEEAKVGRVTFYRHYDQIDDILRRKCDEEYQKWVEHMKMYVNSESENSSFLVLFLRYWYTNPQIIQLVNKADKEKLLEESFIRIVFPAGEKYLPQYFDKEDMFFATLRFTIILTVFKQWFSGEMDITPEELAAKVREGIKVLIESENFI